MTPIEKFYEGLGTKERKFLTTDFPKLLADWYDYPRPVKSEWLTAGSILSRRYHEPEALAIALGHLKEVYPFTVPRTLYRITGIGRLPKKDQVQVGKGSVARKSLLSWTANSEPYVMDRHVEDKDIILSWTRVRSEYVVASYKVLPTLCDHLTKLCATVGEDRGASYARTASIDARLFAKEKEFLVYLFSPIICTWRPA